MNEEHARGEFLDLMRRLETEPEHVLQVTALALRLFDQLSPLHQLSSAERLLLEAASCLHDTGWTVAKDGSGHHKESARLIRAHPWQHFSAAEVEIIAQVARYHRKAVPGADHPEFIALNEHDRSNVQQLAALLRIADALDRSHLQRVKRIDVEIAEQRLHFKLLTAKRVEVEILAAQKKGNLAEALWKRTLEFEEVFV